MGVDPPMPYVTGMEYRPQNFFFQMCSMVILCKFHDTSRMCRTRNRNALKVQVKENFLPKRKETSKIKALDPSSVIEM